MCSLNMNAHRQCKPLQNANVFERCLSWVIFFKIHKHTHFECFEAFIKNNLPFSTEPQYGIFFVVGRVAKPKMEK